MMGGDMLPQNAYAPKDLLIAPKHEYVTAEASVLVGVLVVFYMAVILILFGVNVPCFRWRFLQTNSIPFAQTTRTGRPAIMDNQFLREEEIPKDLQVMVVTDHDDQVITEVAIPDEYIDERSLEGITVV